MRIGIIGAMQEEVQLLVNDLEVSSVEEIGMRKYYIGRLFNRDAVIVFSRWGKVAAASTVTTLIEKFNVDLVLFTGVAGAADSSLNIGDIIIADKLVQYDMDCSKLPGFKKFEIPLLGRAAFVVAGNLLPLASKSALKYISENMRNEIENDILSEFNIDVPRVIVGTIASGDQFIADKDKIEKMSSEIDNLKCVEMEGAAVAQVCCEHGVEFIVFRVMSDKADMHADMNFPKFAEKAASYFTRGIIKQFVIDYKCGK
jgi:adenosylhomocysteine nucleosidase